MHPTTTNTPGLAVHIDAFWQSILEFFGLARPRPRAAVSSRTVISLADLSAMSEHGQLFLAYWLVRNQPLVTIINGDTDVTELLAQNWLVNSQCSTIGVSEYRFRPEVWQQLTKLADGEQFLTAARLRRLRSYIQGKSALYPWLW
ncbi:MAG: hypothetical protein HY986_14505 [Candidatus Melainabacteria bacterium]|nr:hypothetical protein [Candidatus Melainabacteria bacterium]